VKKFLLALVFYHLLVVTSWSAVAFDAAHEGHGTVSSKTVVHTAAGSNRVAVIFASGNNSRTVSSVTYDGVSCTTLNKRTTAQSGADWTEAWYILQPNTTASANVVVTISGTADMSVEVYTFNGVDQSSPFTTGNIVTQTQISNTNNVSVVNAPSGMVVSGMHQGGIEAITFGGSQLGQLDTGSIGGARRDASSYKAGAESVSFTYSWTTSTYTTHIAVPINADSAHIGMTPLTSNSSTSNATSYPTSSVTIHANHLAIAAFQFARDGGTAGTSSVTSTGATWHPVTGALNYHTSGSPTRSVKLFYTMVSSDQTGPLTIDFQGNTQDGCAWSVVEFDGVQTGGTDGSNAVVQFASNAGGSGSTQITCTLNTFQDATNNAVFGLFGRSSNSGITPGSGFTEINDTVYITPSNGLETEWRIGQDTTVDATFGATDCGCQAIEIKMNVPGSNTKILSLQDDEE